MNLTLKPRIFKKGKNSNCKWYCKEFSGDLSLREAFDLKKKGNQFDFDFEDRGKYKDLIEPNKLLLKVCKVFQELEEHIDSKEFQNLTRRILLNGGLVEYTRKLENARAL